MAGLALHVLTASVSDENPCGPDLDAAGDPDFLNFIARAEGLLPATYFSGPDGRPFDRSTIDLEAEFQAAQSLLARTRDIRLLVLLAKFSILCRDLNAFVTCIAAIAQLLETRWQEVHPRGEANDFLARTAVIETLDDSAPVVIPLQYIPLVHAKRFGPVAYRHVMFVNGEATPREGEEAVDQSNIDRAFAEAELSALVEMRSSFQALKDALETIEKCCAANAPGAPVSLEKVRGIVGKIVILLSDAVARRDPGAAAAGAAPAEADGGAAHAPAAGSIRSHADVIAALNAIDTYFCRHEPSNPALLLVRQVRQLAGKSLVEILQILMPAQIAEAKFRLGAGQSVEIPIESLAPIAAIETPAQNFEESEVEVNAPADGASVPAARPKVETRQEAFALLEQIGAYYRVCEPSSPISLLVERARSFANRDFLSVLKDLLPKPPD